LSNFWHIEALITLKTPGLTAEMLLNRYENGHAFNEHHSWALRNLVRNRGYTIQAALEMIDGLSSAQAGGIQEGLFREDVIVLSNFWHIAALITLKTQGLTAEMLLNRHENGHAFNEHHSWALRNLVRDRGYTIQAALEMIDGLSSAQARGIEEGLFREDVIETNSRTFSFVN
ncbi:MAG: hypothetical protein Q8L68_00900, partial [Methylococcales bacterium]|nr:hypothetical protein [Methylococcales bacterium]